MGLFDERQQRQFIEEEETLKRSRPAADVGQPGRRLQVALPRTADVSEVQPAPSSGAHEVDRRLDVVLRLHRLVADRLLRARDESGATVTDVVLDAFDRCWPDLDQVAPPAPARSSPLPPRTRVRRRDVGTTRQVHLLLTAAERQHLEDVVDRTVAGSLTDLVERVLRHHFKL